MSMDNILNDKYVLFSLASICVIVMVCAMVPFNAEGVDGNGMTEMTGMISNPAPSQNGVVFEITDLNGNVFRCFYGSEMPEMPALCRVIGNFSSDGNIFFVRSITVHGVW